ncbi:hypothetical protein Bca52824_073709 [Brassica carinata]|uniref:Uncharacterized protein n=1 Tax=Brassica carinata TaxID=52824 RepID=A0A8X7QAJ7_BRACI|nr:hypothetical protein Bca52824_073709 [Brassica carinata]
MIATEEEVVVEETVEEQVAVVITAVTSVTRVAIVFTKQVVVVVPDFSISGRVRLVLHKQAHLKLMCVKARSVKLGSQLKTIDECDGIQNDNGIVTYLSSVEAYAGLKKIMKEIQAWLKVELREVRRDKRRQGDAEDEQACSSIKRCRHQVRVMDLDQTGGVL